jgi:hypothetical protein
MRNLKCREVEKSWPSPRLEHRHSGKSLGLGLDEYSRWSQLEVASDGRQTPLPGDTPNLVLLVRGRSLRQPSRWLVGSELLGLEPSAKQIRTLPGWASSLAKRLKSRPRLVLELSDWQSRTLPGWASSLAKRQLGSISLSQVWRRCEEFRRTVRL